MFAFGKNKKLLAKLEEFLCLAEETLVEFSNAIDYVLKNGLDDHFVVLAKKVRQCESNSDDIRRSIELEMYEKALLPETREDLLTIIESIDKIPNRAETIVDMFVTQRTELIPEIQEHIHDLTEMSLETFKYTLDATRDCFGKMQRIRELNRLVDNNESLGDNLERKMISIIFASELDTADKILQKELVLQFGEFCDMCENVMDRIVVCSVKRHF